MFHVEHSINLNAAEEFKSHSLSQSEIISQRPKTLVCKSGCLLEASQRIFSPLYP